jgi:ribonucleoside-diphosphate reductase alpha chain
MILGEKAEQVFRGRYAFNDQEDWEGLSRRVGTGLASVEQYSNLWSEKFSEVIHNGLFLPAGRVLRNTGRPRGTLLNCFSLGIEDSIRSIAYQCAKAMILWSEGGGVGFNFSHLRPDGAPIVQKGGESSGPISFLTHYDGGAQTIKTGGDRRAAALGLMVVSHPDIFNFIGAKRIDGLLSNFNLSVGITEAFLDAVEEDADWDLRFNHKIYNTVKARTLWDLMMQYMIEHGDPGLINWDNLRSNNSYYFAKIECTNPCGEAPLANGESCDLGSLVLPNFITGTKNTNWELMRDTIFTAVRMLDNVLNVNRYALDENKDQSMAGRRIGIGIMGLAEYLFAKKLRYGSEAALNSIEYLMRKIRNYSYEASIKLAEEKGSFPKFNVVDYMKGHFITTLPAAIRADIRKYGIRNVTTMAIAPTGTISLLPEVTSSGEPLPFKAYIRNDRIGSRPYIHPIYKDIVINDEETPDWFVDSNDLTPVDHLETQSIIQKYTDGAISKTINVPNETTPEELSALLLEYMRDLKGVTVYRDGSKEGQILVPLSREDAKLAIANENIDTSADEETVKCSSGSCDL